MSCKFFQNRQCEYYPCHKNITNFNCLFCFCPLYLTDCGGKYKLTADGIKDCSDCTIPHKAENYDYIIEKLKNR